MPSERKEEMLDFSMKAYYNISDRLCEKKVGDKIMKKLIDQIGELMARGLSLIHI